MSNVWSCPCGRKWTGTVQAHCTVCHAHFSTVKNFDAHGAVAPPRRCPDPSTRTRTRKDGTVVPKLRVVATVYGDLWISTDGDDREHEQENP